MRLILFLLILSSSIDSSAQTRIYVSANKQLDGGIGPIDLVNFVLPSFDSKRIHDQYRIGIDHHWRGFHASLGTGFMPKNNMEHRGGWGESNTEVSGNVTTTSTYNTSYAFFSLANYFNLEFNLRYKFKMGDQFHFSPGLALRYDYLLRTSEDDHLSEQYYNVSTWDGWSGYVYSGTHYSEDRFNGFEARKSIFFVGPELRFGWSIQDICVELYGNVLFYGDRRFQFIDGNPSEEVFINPESNEVGNGLYAFEYGISISYPLIFWKTNSSGSE
jgi:hypothetical protein